MTSASFTLRATETASTKRSPSLSGGKVGAAVENIASLKCYPPVQLRDPALVAHFATKATSLVYETFVQDGLDIVEGDFLVLDGLDNPIRGVSSYPWHGPGGNRLHIIFEEVQTL